jgi:ribonuclease Z
MPDKMVLPQPPRPRETQQDLYLREIEIDPRKYLPDDVYRDPVTALPRELKAYLRPIKQALRDKEEST